MRGLMRSFYYAFCGLGYLIRTQRNARIELVAGTGACGVGAWAGISRSEWTIIVFTIAFGLILEGLNTSIAVAGLILVPAAVHRLGL